MESSSSEKPLDCLSNLSVDFVIISESELTALELVGFVNDGKAVLTSLGLFIKDLDSLPFPARHLLHWKSTLRRLREKPIKR